jgi:hypothetical protein
MTFAVAEVEKGGGVIDHRPPFDADVTEAPVNRYGAGSVTLMHPMS